MNIYEEVGLVREDVGKIMMNVCEGVGKVTCCTTWSRVGLMTSC